MTPADALVSVRTPEALTAELARLAEEWEFETFSATVFRDQPNGTTTLVSVDNTPAAYLPTFLDLTSGGNDPVMQHCRRSSLPILWSQDSYVEAGAVEKWEIQAQHGYRYGVAMGMHLPRGEHFFLGFDRRNGFPDDRASARMLAEFALLTIQCQIVASSALGASDAGNTAVDAVTPREKEVLAWTLAGKTAWEVGRLLSISERTAAIHANRAAHKLGCISKHQAALKAYRLGLI